MFSSVQNVSRLRRAIAMQSLFARAFACQGKWASDSFVLAQETSRLNIRPDIISTWNIGGRTPNNNLNPEDFLLIEGTADLYICGYES
ncbi:unnamed protein product [Brassica napus]|uniref:(rape) hypothetical protein n=1 Tax=Brassica napus TaxID=3708 RepID=A0A816IXI4_BRANA|nr:unnamed protein product [Brassica napus]